MQRTQQGGKKPIPLRGRGSRPKRQKKLKRSITTTSKSLLEISHPSSNFSKVTNTQRMDLIQTQNCKKFSTSKDVTKFSSIAERDAYENSLVESIEPDILEDIAAEMMLFTIQPYREHVMKLTEVSERLQFTTLEQCALYDSKLTLNEFHSYIDLRVHTHNTRRQKELIKKQLESDPNMVSAKLVPPPPPNSYPHLRPNTWSLPPRLIPSYTENTIQEQAKLFNNIAELSDLVHKYLFNYHKAERIIPPPQLTFENTILAFEHATQRCQQSKVSLHITSQHFDNDYRSFASRSKERFAHMMRLESNNPTMRKVLLKYAASPDAQLLATDQRTLTAEIVTSIFQSMGLREFIYDDLLPGNQHHQHKPGAVKYSHLSQFIHRHMFLLDNLERGLSAFYDLSPTPAKNVAEEEQLQLDNQPTAKESTTDLAHYTGKTNKQLYDELKVIDNHIALKHPLHFKYNKLLRQQNLLMEAISQIEQTHSQLRTLLQDSTQLESVSRHQQNTAVDRLRGTLGHLMAWVDGNASLLQAASGIKLDISYFIASTLERLQDPAALLKNTLTKFRNQPQHESFAHHRPRPIMQLTLNELDGVPDRLLFEFAQRNAKYLTTKVGDPPSMMNKVVPMDDGSSHSGYRETPSIVLGNSPEEYLAVMTFCHSDVVRYRYWLLFHHGANNAYPDSMLPQIDTFRQTDLALLPNPSKIDPADLNTPAPAHRAVDNLRSNNEYIHYEEDLFTVMLDVVVSLRSLLASTGSRLNEVKHIMNEDLSVTAPDFNLESQPTATMGDSYVDEASAQQGVHVDPTKQKSGSGEERTTYLSLVAHESLLQTPDNVRSFVSHLTEIAKTAINDDDLDNPHTMTPHNLPTLLHIKQRLYAEEGHRGFRSGDLIRYMSMRRQYLDAENRTKFTTDTLAAMTTPSLTGYELDHEILRQENFLVEQLNQVALIQIEFKRMNARNQDMDDLFKDFLEMASPNGEHTSFFERFALESGDLLSNKDEFESAVRQESDRLKAKQKVHQQNAEKCRAQLADAYWNHLTTVLNPGIKELPQDDQEDFKTTIREQIITRIRPTVTTLFPWERYYYGRLADPNHPTLQGAGLERDLEDLRVAEEDAVKEIQALESEYTKQGIQENFHSSVHFANQSSTNTTATTSTESTKPKSNSLPHFHPQAARVKDATSPTDASSITPLAAIAPEEDLDTAPLSFLPPIPLQDFHVEMNAINLRRQHQVSTFSLPFEDSEISTYLPLPYVLHNILFIFEELFNIDIVQMPTQFQIHPSDRETLQSFPSINNSQIHLPSIHNSIIHDVWQRDVLAFNVFDRGKRSSDDNKLNNSVYQTSEKPLLGQFYLDLYGRLGKGDSIETQFLGSSYNHVISPPSTNKEHNIVEHIFFPMRKQHSLQFFFDRFDDFEYSEKLEERIIEIQTELQDEKIIQDAPHESHILSEPDVTQFSPEVYKTARKTIQQVSLNHFKKTFSAKLPSLPSKALTGESQSTVPHIPTTVNRSPPITVISFPLYENRALPPVSEVDQLVDKYYMDQIIKARRTGLQANILDTATATALATRASTILDHSAATLMEFKEEHAPTFTDTMREHFNNRRLKLTTLQNLPHLINKTKHPTAPTLLHLEDAKCLFHEFGHMIMHTLDHTPYLNAKALLNNQEVHELVSHLAEQFLFHDHPNKPVVPTGYQGLLPGAPTTPQRQNNGSPEAQLESPLATDNSPTSTTPSPPHSQPSNPVDQISPLDSKLFELYKDIPLYGSFGTLHNLTHHFSYINHGDITHLHNLYHPDAQYVYKKYVSELSKLVFPESKNARLNVLFGNTETNYKNTLDFRQFSSSLRYISNYYNTKNAPKWKQNLVEFDQNITLLDRAATVSGAGSQQNELGFGHPILHQAMEFGIVNDKRSVTEIETTLKNMQKTDGRIIQPFSIDKLMYVALKQTDIEYDESASRQHASLPWQAKDTIPATQAERQKLQQKLYSRFPPKPPLSYYHNILTRETMSSKIDKHESITDALVDHHLHMVEYLGDPENSGMVHDSDDDYEDSSDVEENAYLAIEDVPQSSRMRRKAMEAAEYLARRQNDKQQHQTTNQNNIHAIPQHGFTKDADTASVAHHIDSDTTSVAHHIDANTIIDVIDPNTTNVTSSFTSAADDTASPNKSKIIAVDQDTLLVDDSTKDFMKKNEGPKTLSLEYFTSQVFNFDNFRVHFSDHQAPIAQLKKRPVSGKHAVVSQFAASWTDKSKQIQDDIIAIQHKQRKKSTLLFDRVRALREAQIDQHQAKIDSQPVQRRPVDISLQQIKYQYLLPQYIFVPQDTHRYQLSLQQAQGTTSFSNNVFRTLQFLLENPPSIISDINSLTKDERTNDDPLGTKMFPPATPTLPAYESVKTIAHNLDHLYSRYAGQLYAYPYAEMLAEELFEANFLTKSNFNAEYNPSINLIQQQRRNSHRMATDIAFSIPSDINYELTFHDTIVRLSTTSPLTPNTPLYGLAQDQSAPNVSNSNNSNEEDGATELLGPTDAKIRQRPSVTLPFGYYKSAYISKPSVAYVNQYFNREKSQQFKDCLKTFEQHNIIDVLSQFSTHKSDDLLHFYKQPKV